MNPDHSQLSALLPSKDVPNPNTQPGLAPLLARLSSAHRMMKRGKYTLQYEGFRGLLKEVQQRLSGHHKRHHVGYSAMLSLESPKDKFTKIYEENLWGGVESLSGPGSHMDTTKNLRDHLPRLIEDFGICSMVDAPCGDFAWMKHVLPELDIDYIGCDIVDFVVDRNTANYGKDRVTFLQKDICADRLPDADLIMVRDCLFHLSYQDINRFLAQLARVDYKFLLTTTHFADPRLGIKNSDIVTGDFRRIDLFAPPFAFRREDQLSEVKDYLEGERPRKMFLIAKDDVPTALLQTEPA